jgi:GNAT superfamily N-acetyltransferase
MRICRLTPDGLDKFLKFNQMIDPNRNDFVERFQFQVLENPLLEDNTRPYIFVAYDDDGQIIGQHLHNPFEYFFKGKQLKGFYGYDFFVPENHRNKGIGSAIARQAKTDFFPHFGVGVSEASQRIQLSLGNRIIGYLFTYIWIRNLFSPVKFGLNQILKKTLINNSTKLKNLNFPNKLRIKDYQFKLVDLLAQWNYNYWSHETLEFSRSLDFINWRFLRKKDKYFFYLLDETNSSTYFVVRKIFAKGLRLLALIDYRMPFEDKARIKLILQAAKKMAKLGEFDGIFTMSSYQFFDENLKGCSFFKVGKPIVILTNAGLDIDPKRISQRNAVFATMAESDLDFYFEF